MQLKMLNIIDLAVDFERAVVMSTEVIKRDGVVLIPTETVYGLSCRFNSPAAVKRVSEIKLRKMGKKFIVLISSRSQLGDLGLVMNRAADILADEFWPGPLTMILPDIRGNTLAVRYSSSVFINRLIDESGPIISTSANLSGQSSPALFSEIDKELLNRVDLAVNGGTLPGVPSTVLDVLQDSPRILRQGTIGFDDIISVLKKSD
ncbi:MAG: threonylcarbamoyl-AMP synthase [Omnitrophica WOR_2 bacterium RBG_13_44_8]|nr:MAG: threonylcarbamoyl-AMP synthase [Omnitrophica WOR_2 bacterium RBG_13_44_8]